MRIMPSIRPILLPARSYRSPITSKSTIPFNYKSPEPNPALEKFVTAKAVSEVKDLIHEVNKTFAPRRTDEKYEFYSGFRHFKDAQPHVAHNKMTSATFITHDLDTAADYSNGDSVILMYVSKGMRASDRDYDGWRNPYGSKGYHSPELADMDGVRPIKVILGEGEYRNPSAIWGTHYSD